MFSDWWEEQIRLAVEKAKKETARDIYKFADDFMKWDEEMFVPSLLEFIKEKYGVIGEEV